MKRYVVGLLLLASIQMHASQIVFSDANPPGKRTSDEVAMTSLWENFDGGDGKISTDMSAATLVKGVAIDTNGDIYVCGSFGSTAVMFIARYRKNSNGVYALDTNWDSSGNGYVTPGSSVFDSGSASVANAIALDGNYIYVTGSADISTVSKVIGKIKKSDGTPETAFSSDGFVLSGLGTSAVGHGIVVDGDYVYAVGTDGSDMSITKVHKVTGTLHAEFDGDSGTGGSNGELTIDVSGGTDVAYDLIVDSSDPAALYIVGDAGSKFGMVKMAKATGKLYTSANGYTAFSTDGLIASGNGVAKAIAQDSSNLYVAGRSTGSDDGIVKKYKKSDGSFNSDFGTSGSWSSSNAIDTLEDIRVLNGKVYVAGKNASVMAIARLNKTGSSPLDTSFFTNGYDVALGSNATGGAFALDFLHEPNLPVLLVGNDSSGNYIELTAYENDVNPIKAAALGELPAGYIAGALVR